MSSSVWLRFTTVIGLKTAQGGEGQEEGKDMFSILRILSSPIIAFAQQAFCTDYADGTLSTASVGVHLGGNRFVVVLVNQVVHHASSLCMHAARSQLALLLLPNAESSGESVTSCSSRTPCPSDIVVDEVAFEWTFVLWIVGHCSISCSGPTKCPWSDVRACHQNRDLRQGFFSVGFGPCHGIVKA